MKYMYSAISAIFMTVFLTTSALSQDSYAREIEMLRNYVEVERAIRQLERVGELRLRAGQLDLIKPPSSEPGTVNAPTSPTGPVVGSGPTVASSEQSCFASYDKALSNIDNWYENCSRECDGFFCELGCSAIARGREIAAGAGYAKCTALR